MRAFYATNGELGLVYKNTMYCWRLRQQNVSHLDLVHLDLFARRSRTRALLW